MANGDGLGAPRGDPFGAKLFALSEGLAVLGGISLLAITIFTVTQRRRPHRVRRTDSR